MRFLNTSHTIAEYKHQQMPVYETLAAIGTTAAVGLGASAATAATVGGVAGALGTAALGAGVSYGASKLMGGGGRGSGGGGGGGAGMPTYNDYQIQQDAKKYAQMAQNYADMSQQYIPKANDFAPVTSEIYNSAAQRGIDFANMGTRANIANQELVTPGSQAQRQLAQNQINEYIQGRVPSDVQQNTQRAIAQSFGGGYNPFSGGGQAPSAFARNIGQTSVGLSQFGLSAAPTWQQLANSMVVSPQVGLGASLQSRQLANSQIFGTSDLGMRSAGMGMNAATIGLQSLGLGMQGAENAYQAGFNNYQAGQIANQGNQMANQNQQQFGMQLANTGLGIAKDYLKSAYTSQIPSYMGYGNPGQTWSQYGTQLGYSEGETPTKGTGY